MSTSAAIFRIWDDLFVFYLKVRWKPQCSLRELWFDRNAHLSGPAAAHSLLFRLFNHWRPVGATAWIFASKLHLGAKKALVSVIHRWACWTVNQWGRYILSHTTAYILSFFKSLQNRPLLRHLFGDLYLRFQSMREVLFPNISGWLQFNHHRGLSVNQTFNVQNGK